MPDSESCPTGPPNIMKLHHAYAAGLIDGEGSILLTRSHTNERRTISVSMTSTTKELLEFLKRHYSGTIVSFKQYSSAHKPSWAWKVVGNNALSFLAKIEPYLLEPEKKRRSKLVLAEYKKVTPRNGRYTAELLQKKLEFEEEFFRNSNKVQR